MGSNNGNNHNKNNNTSLQITEENVRQFIQLQTAELQSKKDELSLRKEEISLRHEELKHSMAYAKDALAAQTQDQENERKHERSLTKIRTWALFLSLCVLLSFTGYAFFIGKEAVVIELIKTLASLFIGAFGGFYYGKQRGTEESNKED